MTGPQPRAATQNEAAPSIRGGLFLVADAGVCIDAVRYGSPRRATQSMSRLFITQRFNCLHRRGLRRELHPEKCPGTAGIHKRDREPAELTTYFIWSRSTTVRRSRLQSRSQGRRRASSRIRRLHQKLAKAVVRRRADRLPSADLASAFRDGDEHEMFMISTPPTIGEIVAAAVSIAVIDPVTDCWERRIAGFRIGSRHCPVMAAANDGGSSGTPFPALPPTASQSCLRSCGASAKCACFYASRIHGKSTQKNIRYRMSPA